MAWKLAICVIYLAINDIQHKYNIWHDFHFHDYEGILFVILFL